MDTPDLEATYRSLLETARAGGFRTPGDTAQWPAERVLAHVVATDRLLSAVTAGVLAGRTTRYDNAVAGDAAYLDAIARAAGDWDGLVAEVRRCGLELVLLLRQLDDARATTAVHTRLVDGEDVRMESPMPWSGVIATHTQVDLPDHERKLEALR